MGSDLSKVHIHPGVLVAHANARTTVHGRLLIVQRHRPGWRQAHIAAAIAVSRNYVRTWIERYASEVPDGLHDRSSCPHHRPTRTPEDQAEVVDLRQQERLGPDEFSVKTGVPARTVYRILARHAMPHLAALDPMTA